MSGAAVFLAQWALMVGFGWLAAGRVDQPPLVRLARAHLVGAALLALSLHWLLLAGVEAPPVWAVGALAFVLAIALFVVRRIGSQSEMLSRASPPAPLPRGEGRRYSQAATVLPSPRGRGAGGEARDPHQPRDITPNLDVGPAPWYTWLLWLLRALLLLGVLTLIARMALLPLDWDGWAIWAMKAKALSQGNLRALLSDPAYYYSHQDYPLLVPMQSWWLSGGGFSEKSAQAGGLLFALDLLVLVYDHLRRRGEGPALAACVVIVSLAPFAKHATSGFADIPIAAYALATCLALREGRTLDLALCLIGALLTKNEGLFALAAVFGALLLSPNVLGAGGGRRAPAIALAAGMALALLPWMWVKRHWGTGADLLDPSQWVFGEMAARMGVIAQGFARQALAMGPQYPGWGLLWPAVIASAVLSIRDRRRETGALWLFLLTFFAGAVAAYLVTPLNPALHLDRSVDRLWLHVAPIAVIAIAETLTGARKNSPPTE